ncbi:hypothetical protein TNCV_1117431 [Trichonephila clavipes]|nr:hypothetical protein TNCV_1117431 [Trichonephila clavipes]
MVPPAHKAHQTVSFSGCNGVSTYNCGLASLQMRQFFVDVAIQPEVRFVAKQNSLMKIGNNGNLGLGPFDESTPCLIIFKMQKFRMDISLGRISCCLMFVKMSKRRMAQGMINISSILDCPTMVASLQEDIRQTSE